MIHDVLQIGFVSLGDRLGKGIAFTLHPDDAGRYESIFRAVAVDVAHGERVADRGQEVVVLVHALAVALAALERGFPTTVTLRVGRFNVDRRTAARVFDDRNFCVRVELAEVAAEKSVRGRNDWRAGSLSRRVWLGARATSAFCPVVRPKALCYTMPDSKSRGGEDDR